MRPIQRRSARQPSAGADTKPTWSVLRTISRRAVAPAPPRRAAVGGPRGGRRGPPPARRRRGLVAGGPPGAVGVAGVALRPVSAGVVPSPAGLRVCAAVGPPPAAARPRARGRRRVFAARAVVARRAAVDRRRGGLSASAGARRHVGRVHDPSPRSRARQARRRQALHRATLVAHIAA